MKKHISSPETVDHYSINFSSPLNSLATGPVTSVTYVILDGQSERVRLVQSKLFDWTKLELGQYFAFRGHKCTRQHLGATLAVRVTSVTYVTLNGQKRKR